MRLVILAVAGAVLAGCAVNDGNNPNYLIGDKTSYDQYRHQREAALMSGSAAPHAVPVTLPVDALTVEEIRAGGPVKAQPAAQARRANVPPRRPDLPVATSGPYQGSTPVLVRYAFEVDHQPGTRVWARSGGAVSSAAVCARYASADRAQLAFLGAGGPQRDPRGLDPDGDGFVCGWNPAAYRANQL